LPEFRATGDQPDQEDEEDAEGHEEGRFFEHPVETTLHIAGE